ncbi:MAG: tetratricopeptide repeat protein [Myxococcales bacterium]|nr:tetratricopeptide repeat protein [Myxococcales bacterium]
MLTLLIALLAAVAVTGGLKLAFATASWSLIFPFLLTLVGVLILMFQVVGRRIQPIVKEAERHLLGARRELALKSLRDGLRYQAWHPMIAAQLRAQIGALHYDTGELDQAEAELRRASRWPWTSRALLGCVYFKRKDGAKMKKAFETAVKVGDKEPLAWTLYAYCLISRGDREDAVKVLERALKKNPADARLTANLELAKEGKKLKVAPYGDKWARFNLDGEGPVVPKAARGFAVRPGFRQKPMRKR